MSKIELSQEEFGELVEEVLLRLAGDKSAAHLWQWCGRPGCEDEPAGLSRRKHLRSLLGLVGMAATPLAAACGDSGKTNPADGDDAGTLDGGQDAGQDAVCADDPCVCSDDPCAIDAGLDAQCADDPCNCADDPCR